MDKRGYRECIRVIIVKGDKILLGDKIIKNKFVCYEFPGGGIEEGESIESTVIKECLEEVGILVEKPIDLGLSYQYDIDYPNPERAKLYRGGKDIWYSATYVRRDKKLHNIENDALPYQWVTITEAKQLILMGPESTYNKARLEALAELEKRLISANKPHFVDKW